MKEVLFRNRRAMQLEDDSLRLTVSVEGGHIAELLEKKTDINPLWQPPWPSIEPSAYCREKHPEYGSDSESKLLSGILGHNLCLDYFGGPSAEEFAAGLTVHGEASIVPYTFSAVEGGMKAEAQFPIAMMRFQRTMQLEGAGTVRIREELENLTGMDRPVGWTQHVTLGPPFIERGVTRFSLPVRKSKSYPAKLGPAQTIKPYTEFEWPMAPAEDGTDVDLRVYPAKKSSAMVTGHLVEENRTYGHFFAWHPHSRLAIGYLWKRADFPWIALWDENHSRFGPPWNGRSLTRGVEFGVSPWAEGRRAMVDRGSLFGTPVYRWIPARSRVAVEYLALVRVMDRIPEEVPEDIVRLLP